MSEAFDRAMKEVDRIWDATDKFDTKVLQFVGFVIAGTLAGAGAMLTKLQMLAPVSCLVTTLLILGTAAVLAFIALALSSAIGNPISAPLNPEQVRDHPPFLDDDKEFEKSLLPAIATAHRQSFDRQQKKAARFRISLWVLGIGIVCLVAACMICTLVPAPKKGETTVSAENTGSNQAPTTNQPAASPAPASTETAKPVLTPYTVDRSLPDSGGPKVNK